MKDFVTQEIFGGISNYDKSCHKLISYLRHLMFLSWNQKLMGYHTFGNIRVTCDNANLYIAESDEIFLVPISGKILHVEKHQNKYYVYQSTEQKLTVDEVDNIGQVRRKEFLMNLKSPASIQSMSTSENFYMMIDKENHIYIAPKNSRTESQHTIEINMNSYIGDELQFNTSTENTQICEYEDKLIIYLYNSKEKFIVRLQISKESYRLIHYDIIYELKNCESFDSKAMFVLDKYIFQNEDSKILPENVVYMRNDGDKVIIGHVNEEDKIVHTILSNNSGKINILCSFITDDNGFFADTAIPIHLKDQSILIAVQGHQEGFRFVAFDYSGNILSEQQELEMNESGIVLLFRHKSLTLDINSNEFLGITPVVSVDNTFPQTQEEIEEEYEYDFSNVVTMDDEEEYDYDYNNIDSLQSNRNQENITSNIDTEREEFNTNATKLS